MGNKKGIDSDLLLIMGIGILSLCGGCGIGWVASLKFAIWVACLWGFGSYIAFFIVGLATWGVADTLQWTEKHRREDEKGESLGGKG